MAMDTISVAIQSQPSLDRSEAPIMQSEPAVIPSQPIDLIIQTGVMESVVIPSQPGDVQSQLVALESPCHTAAMQFPPVVVKPLPIDMETHLVAMEPQPMSMQFQPMTTQLQSVNIESQPIVTQLQSYVMQSTPIYLQPQAVNIEPQLMDMQLQPMATQSQPVNIESQLMGTKSQSYVMQPTPKPLQSQLVKIQSQPMDMQFQPIATQSQPVNVQSQLMGTQSHSYVIQSTPKHLHSQLVNIQSQTMDMQFQPTATQSEPVKVQSQLMDMQFQPIATQSQPVNVQSQPMGAQSQSYVTQSTPMHLASQPMVIEPQPIQSYTVNQTPHTKFQQWDEIPSAVFICRLCKKTFYNANALQNHKKVHHDGEVSCSENEYTSTFHEEQDWYHFIKRGGFKFVPNESDCSSDVVSDGLTTRMYSEDTTYIIVKVEGDDGDSRTQGTRKVSSVDLRGPFTCTFPTPLGPERQCRQIFFNCCDYSLHYREEHTKRRKAALRCQVCEKRLDRDFNPTVSLAAQLQAANQTTFSCRMCGQTFLDSYQYDEHNRIVHAKMKPHQCPLCTKRFTQQGGLQQHLRMHSGIRPFVCTFCPKAFTQKAGLDQHLRTHTKVKPFMCVICSKSFSQSVHLRQHMRTHTNIQPFECSVCRRRFKQSSHLNFHMRCHVSEGTLAMESYAQVIQQQNQLEFLNLANLQQVQDGETLYYAAEIAPPMHSNISNLNTFSY